MKLIDILVQELPKDGGWPECCHALVQGSSGTVYLAGGGMPLWKFPIAEDWELAEVTREQYEAALAAAQPQWDGNYPIKAGTNVEVHFDGDDSRVWTEFRVEYMREDVVVLHDYRSDGVNAYSNKKLNFRPIRSEADKKRDEAVVELSSVIDYRNGCSSKPLAGWLYDAIAAGEIPHIRIE